MRQSKFKDAQIVEIIREADSPGGQVTAICRKHGISEGTFYRWKKQYGGMSAPKAARLRQLEQENARMRKLIVDRDLELDVARELLKKNF